MSCSTKMSFLNLLTPSGVEVRALRKAAPVVRTQSVIIALYVSCQVALQPRNLTSKDYFLKVLE